MHFCYISLPLHSLSSSYENRWTLAFTLSLGVRGRESPYLVRWDGGGGLSPLIYVLYNKQISRLLSEGLRSILWASKILWGSCPQTHPPTWHG